jgi:hypothetical protein
MFFITSKSILVFAGSSLDYDAINLLQRPRSLGPLVHSNFTSILINIVLLYNNVLGYSFRGLAGHIML